MNPVFAGLLRIIVPSAISYATGKGWITQDMVTQVGTLLATVAAAGGWSAAANTTFGLAKSVAAVPGLTVHVDNSAPVEMQKAAVNGAVPDIVPATSADRMRMHTA